MTKEETLSSLTRIIDDYNALKDPKFRNADIGVLKRDYDLLMEMKEFQKGNADYAHIVNAISQTISKMTIKTDNKWRTVSERGINKAISPVVRKKNHVIKYPFEWTNKSGETLYINNDYWGARNYMVMDVVGYCLLLKEGQDLLPKEPMPIFNDMDSIAQRESDIIQNGSVIIDPTTMNKQDIERFEKSRYWIHFTDKDFRKFTSLDMNSNEIRDLLLETSRVEFKLVFPVRMKDHKGMKEKTYRMNFFSRLFEFGYIDKEIRNDGIIVSREYYISFNTVLGELFVHNLLTKNYDWLESRFYVLPNNAQVFYRKFLLHNNYKSIQINLKTIKGCLNLDDRNITNLRNTVERNILEPLIDHGLIDSYESDAEGLYGLKYAIKWSKKVKPNEQDS